MKIRQRFLELQLKMSGMFFETQCIKTPFSIQAGMQIMIMTIPTMFLIISILLYAIYAKLQMH